MEEPKNLNMLVPGTMSMLRPDTIIVLLPGTPSKFTTAKPKLKGVNLVLYVRIVADGTPGVDNMWRFNHGLPAIYRFHFVPAATTPSHSNIQSVEEEAKDPLPPAV